MLIPFIDQPHVAINDVSDLLDRYGIDYHRIANVNWKDEYPYCPDVKFRIAHNGKNIIAEYVVQEESVRAVADNDNGNVWEDSCVEMFIAFDRTHYYNIECNCRGKILLACGPDRNNRTYSPMENIARIQRISSIVCDEPFDNRPAPREWKLQLLIPADVFFKDHMTDMHGVYAHANFYKCGDMLPTPHFLSWKPIDVASPDFHLPEFFGEIAFE